MSTSRRPSARRWTRTSSAKIIPSRGSWIEFEIDKKDIVNVKIDRKRKQPVTVLLKALGLTPDEIAQRFGQYESMRLTMEKDAIATQDEAFVDIYRKRPGEPASIEAGRNSIENFFFNPKRYDLAVGRYKLNKLGGSEEPSKTTLSVEDIVRTVEYLVRLHNGEQTMPDSPARVEVDDIDHFGNFAACAPSAS